MIKTGDENVFGSIENCTCKMKILDSDRSGDHESLSRQNCKNRVAHVPEACCLPHKLVWKRVIFFFALTIQSIVYETILGKFQLPVECLRRRSFSLIFSESPVLFFFGFQYRSSFYEYSPNSRNNTYFTISICRYCSPGNQLVPYRYHMQVQFEPHLTNSDCFSTRRNIQKSIAQMKIALRIYQNTRASIFSTAPHFLPSGFSSVDILPSSHTSRCYNRVKLAIHRTNIAFG